MPMQRTRARAGKLVQRATSVALAFLFTSVSTAAAQHAPATLFGTVYGGADTPLLGVEVILDSAAAATTNAAGHFRISGLDPGPHVLTLRATGFARRTFRFTVPANPPEEIDVGAIMLERQRSETVILGSVTDARTGSPIPAAVVSLDGAVNVATNLDGEFRIADVTPGQHVLQVRRIGFRRALVTIDFPANDPGIEVEIELDPVPVELPEVVVEGERTLYAYGRLRDFYERRSRGVGHFITRWDLEKRVPRLVSEALFGVPGLQVTPGPLGLNSIRMADPSLSCQTPLFFLDGSLIRGGNPDEFLTPQDVEGIEIYTRITEVPPVFTRQSGSNCGVIAVWTR